MKKRNGASCKPGKRKGEEKRKVGRKKKEGTGTEREGCKTR